MSGKTVIVRSGKTVIARNSKTVIARNEETKQSRTSIGLVSLLFFSILLIPATSTAQITFDLQPRQITIGDPIEMTISLTVPENGSVIWPGPDELAPAEIIRLDTVNVGKAEQTARYTLSLFEPGEFELTDVPVIISKPDGTDTLKIDPGKIVVQSVIDPTDSTMDIKDIHPPVKLAWTFRDLLPYMIVIAALILIGIAGYIIWRKWKIRRGEIVLPEPPPIPPHVIAIDKLEDLRIKKLWQNGYLKEYHSELSEIVKEYIGGRYEINAPEMTTFELMESKWKWATYEERLRLIKRILTCSDLVKFARYKADPHENEKSLDYAFEYVDSTKERSEMKEEKKENVVATMLEEN